MEAFDVYRPASIRRDMTYTSEPEWHLPPWTDAISASNTEPHQDDWDF